MNGSDIYDSMSNLEAFLNTTGLYLFFCKGTVTQLSWFNWRLLSFGTSTVASGASGSFSTNSPASPLSSVSLTSPLSPFSPVSGSQVSPTKQTGSEVSVCGPGPSHLHTEWESSFALLCLPSPVCKSSKGEDMSLRVDLFYPTDPMSMILRQRG